MKESSWSGRPLPGDASAPARGLSVLSVSELTRGIRTLLEEAYPGVRVHGEISNVSRPQSGHVYFTLLDDGGGSTRLTSAQIPCVLWRGVALREGRRIENGQRVVLAGRIGVYEPRGTYQLIVESVEPVGLGDLQRRFEELKGRLRAEGLFAPERKRPLPFLPRRIGIVTSPTGAAVRDVLRVIYLRQPEAWVRVAPVRVQGEGAAEEIARAIETLGEGGGQVDVIILTRGGGSLEDLWAFNEERVARALARSSVPTISAVGHEVDFSISDFVADVRAQTPTQAAELVVPRKSEMLEDLRGFERRLQRAALAQLEARRSFLDRIASRRILREPGVVVDRLLERCDDLGARLGRRGRELLGIRRERLAALAGRLEALGPLKVLARGYAVVRRREVEVGPPGAIVHDAASLSMGQVVELQFHRGTAAARVLSVDGGAPAGGSKRPREAPQDGGAGGSP